MGAMDMSPIQNDDPRIEKGIVEDESAIPEIILSSFQSTPPGMEMK